MLDYWNRIGVGGEHSRALTFYYEFLMLTLTNIVFNIMWQWEFVYYMMHVYVRHGKTYIQGFFKLTLQLIQVQCKRIIVHLYSTCTM